MFLLIYIIVNIKFFPPVARMQAWRRLRHWSMPLSITLCYTPTHASNSCRVKSFTQPPCAFLVDSLSSRWLRFKCNEIEARAVRWPKVWKFYGSLTLLHLQSGGIERCTECQDRHSSQKKITTRIYQKWWEIAAYITNLLQMSEDTIILCISSWRTNYNWCWLTC